jgi:MYXO-CTERM domain-containing protein
MDYLHHAAAPLAHKMRNNVGFPNKNTNMSGVDSMFNTWDLNISEANTDFVSTSDAGFMGPRQADGSLPALDFLRLKQNSPLIDKGTDVGLAYAGSAPDLGAYEYGLVASSAGAGAGGSSASSGGSSASAGKGSGGANAAAGAASSSGGAPSADGGDSGNGSAVAGSAVAGSAVMDMAGRAGRATEEPAAAGSGTASSSGDTAGCTCFMGPSSAPRPERAALLLLGIGIARLRRRRFA